MIRFYDNAARPGKAARLGDAARSGETVRAAGTAELSQTETTEVDVAARPDGTAMGDVPPAVPPPPRWCGGLRECIIKPWLDILSIMIQAMA